MTTYFRAGRNLVELLLLHMVSYLLVDTETDVDNRYYATLDLVNMLTRRASSESDNGKQI